MQVMLLQYAHLVLELRQQLPSGHERPEQIPPKLDALRSAISVSTPQHRPAAITLDAGFGQHAPKLATPSGGPVSMMHGAHVPDAVQADLPQPAHPAAQPRPHSRPLPRTRPLVTHRAGGAGAAAAACRGAPAAGGAAEDGGRGGIRSARPGLRRALARPRPAEAAGGRRWAAAPAAALQDASLLSHCRAPAARPAGSPLPPPPGGRRPTPCTLQAAAHALQPATLCTAGARSRRRSRSPCSRARSPS